MYRIGPFKSLIYVVMGTLALLLVPAIAMQFSSAVAWGPGDFAAAGLLLFAVGAAIVLAQQIKKRGPRLLVVSVVVLVVGTVWAELAVGLFH